MKVLIQRVTEAQVTVDNQEVGAIGPGLLIFLGVTKGDTEKSLNWLVDKVCGLRIFSDDQDKMNLSLLDKGYSVLLVSQFTLCGDCQKGRRPGFDAAAPPETAKNFYEKFIESLTAKGVNVATGQFAAHMRVSLINDGPVTFMIESPVA